MPPIKVTPAELTAHAKQLDAAGADMLKARGALHEVRAAGPASGFGPVEEAADHLASAWSAALLAQHGAIGTLAGAVRQSAGAYGTTDTTQYGGPGMRRAE